MHLRAFAVFTYLLAPTLAGAQDLQLDRLPLAYLQTQATEVVDFTLGPSVLKLTSKLMDESDPEEADMKRLFAGLKKVTVRSYQFDSDFAYAKKDIEAVRAQLARPGWTQLARVRDRKDDEEVDIYIAMERDRATGFAIIASEPRGFTILNIVGTLELEQVAKLQHHMHLPGVDIDDVEPAAP